MSILNMTVERIPKRCNIYQSALSLQTRRLSSVELLCKSLCAAVAADNVAT